MIKRILSIFMILALITASLPSSSAIAGTEFSAALGHAADGHTSPITKRFDKVVSATSVEIASVKTASVETVSDDQTDSITNKFDKVISAAARTFTGDSAEGVVKEGSPFLLASSWEECVHCGENRSEDYLCSDCGGCGGVLEGSDCWNAHHCPTWGDCFDDMDGR